MHPVLIQMTAMIQITPAPWVNSFIFSIVCQSGRTSLQFGRLQRATRSGGAFVPGDDPFNVFLQEVDRDGEQHEILQKEGRIIRHRWKASGAGIPRVRNERHGREGSDEGEGRTEGAEHARFLVPETQKQQRAKGPF